MQEDTALFIVSYTSPPLSFPSRFLLRFIPPFFFILRLFFFTLEEEEEEEDIEHGRDFLFISFERIVPRILVILVRNDREEG